MDVSKQNESKNEKEW